MGPAIHEHRAGSTGTGARWPWRPGRSGAAGLPGSLRGTAGLTGLARRATDSAPRWRGWFGRLQIGFAQQHRFDRAAGDTPQHRGLDGRAMGLEAVQRIAAVEAAAEDVVQDLLAHDGADRAAVRQGHPAADGTGFLVEEGLGRGVAVLGNVHAATLPRPRGGVGAPADTAPRRRWLPWHLGVVAALAFLALSIALLQALATAAELGNLRREAHAAHAQATWRCQALRDASARADCLARRTPVPRLNADLRGAQAATP